MKSLLDFKGTDTLLEANRKKVEKKNYKKFDVLVRAGLADKTKLAKLHRILDKMETERPVFPPHERRLLQDLFGKMVGLLTDNPQIFQRTRRAVREEVEHPIELEQVVEKKGDNPKDPPFVLLLKRKSFRPYPNGMKVALYYNAKLNKYFTVPYGPKGIQTPLQSEEVNRLNNGTFEESTMDHLHNIVANKQHKTVKFANGKSQKVDHYTASAMTNVHKNLNDVNKKKYADLVHKSPEHFRRGSDFAFKAHSAAGGNKAKDAK